LAHSSSCMTCEREKGMGDGSVIKRQVLSAPWFN